MHHIFYHSWKSEMMMLWRSTSVIINNVVYCLRCIVQVHVVNQNYLMFIYYLYLIINDIYTWWEPSPWLVAFENRLMNSIQKKSRDHKSCDQKKKTTSGQRHQTDPAGVGKLLVVMPPVVCATIKGIPMTRKEAWPKLFGHGIYGCVRWKSSRL